MDIATLTTFFMWCTIINGGLLLLWISLWGLAPKLVYATQARWIGNTGDEIFSIVFYSFLGLFKIVFLVFNLVPWIALMIIGQR